METEGLFGDADDYNEEVYDEFGGSFSTIQASDLENPSLRIEKLNELCTLLCIAQEHEIRSFSVGLFAPILLQILNQTSTEEIREAQLLAVRALASILDMVPHSCATILAQKDSIPILISYFKQLHGDESTIKESKEEVLKCLSKITIEENPKQLYEDTNLILLLVNSLVASDVSNQTNIQEEQMQQFRGNFLNNKILDLMCNLARKADDLYPCFELALPTIAKAFENSESYTEISKLCTFLGYLLDHFEVQLNKIITPSWIHCLQQKLAQQYAQNKRNTVSVLTKFLCCILGSAHCSDELKQEFCKESFLELVCSILDSSQQQMNRQISDLFGANIELLYSTNSLLFDILHLLNHLFSSQEAFATEHFHLDEISSTAKHEWFWEDDFHNFNKYDEKSALQMEIAYKKKSAELKLRIMGNQYRIDLKTMKQYNISSGLMRNVIRHPIPFDYARNTEELEEEEESNKKKKKGSSGIIEFFSKVFKRQRIHSPPSSPSSSSSPYVENTNSINVMIKPLMHLAEHTTNVSLKQNCLFLIIKLLAMTYKSNSIEVNRIATFFIRFLMNTEDKHVTESIYYILELYCQQYSTFKQVLLWQGITQVKDTPCRKVFLETVYPHSTLIESSENLITIAKELPEQLLSKLLTLLSKEYGTIPIFQWIQSSLLSQLSSDAMLFSQLKHSLTTNEVAFVNFVKYLNECIGYCEEEFDILEEDSKIDASFLKQTFSKLVKLELYDEEDHSIEVQCEPLVSISHVICSLRKQQSLDQNTSIQLFTQDDKPISNHCIVFQATKGVYHSKFKYTLQPKETVVMEYAISNLLVKQILDLLKQLYSPQYRELFVNHFLSFKLNHMITNTPLIAMLKIANGTMLQWPLYLCKEYSFLFASSLKHAYLYFIFVGAVKLLSLQQSNRSNTNTNSILVRKKNYKIIIQNKEQILQEAMQRFEEMSEQEGTLEVEFEGEKGFGVGPTLSFYHLISLELLKNKLNLWLHSNTNEETYSFHSEGIFPSSNQFEKLYYFVGQFLAKVIQDQRLCSLLLSKPLASLLIENRKHLTREELQVLQPFHFQALQTIKEQKHKVDSMYLTFECQGIELKTNGSQLEVNSQNVEEYIELLEKFLLQKQFQNAIEWICKGFDSILSLHYLQLFSVEELIQTVSGSSDEQLQQEFSNKDYLEQQMECKHGYTNQSLPVQWLLEVLVTEFTKEERIDFVEFISGSQRLPIGGFSQLRPKFTIVKSGADDAVLPTCNTCFHFLKLPQYSSREILKKKLQLAIREGKSTFELS